MKLKITIGRFLTIVENYYTVRRPDAAIIAAFTPKMRLIMIHQYRHPVKAADYEIPAGFMNNSVHFFIGFNAKKIAEQKLDNSEELEVHIMPWKKALKYLKEEKIKDLCSVTGILLTKNYLESTSTTPPPLPSTRKF